MKNNRTLSLLVRIMMVLSLFVMTIPTITEAATFEDYSYNIINDNTEVEITGYSGGSKDIIIPSEIEGKPVTKIGWSAFEEKQLSSVIIPEGVRRIENKAFKNNQIVSLIIPEGVNSIGNDAFSENHLSDVTIPSSLIYVDGFSNNQLTSVTIPEGVKIIGDFAFSNNQLKSVLIPSSVTNLGGFSNNKLTSITIPKGVTTIGVSAFTGNQLTSLIIPDGVNSIEKFAFFGNQLENLIIPEELTSIGSNAFTMNKLTNLTIPKGVKSIGDSAFSTNKLNNVIISCGVTTIGNTAFQSNELSDIIIPSSVTFIGVDAFSYNKQKLESFIIYGELGSRAESYANSFNHTFKTVNNIEIESINLNKTNLNLKEGATETLLATVLPEHATNKKVSWSSSNPLIASVDDHGLVTAVSDGEAIITVTTEDGNHVASCKVIVQSINNWGTIESQYGISIDKTWEIKFNKILSIDTIKEKNIYVTDQKGEIIPMFYYQSDQVKDKVIYVTPVKDYNSGNTYTIWIKDLKAKDGSILKKNVKMNFTIR